MKNRKLPVRCRVAGCMLNNRAKEQCRTPDSPLTCYQAIHLKVRR